MREPVRVSQDSPPPAADIRIYQWTGAAPNVFSVRDLTGMGYLLKIKSIHAEIDNTAGPATETYLQLLKQVDTTAIIFCDMVVPIDAGIAATFIDWYIGASTIEVEPDVWTYALPDLLLTDEFSIGLIPNVMVDGTYTMLYEVYRQ
jgi:hypothetical protein